MKPLTRNGVRLFCSKGVIYVVGLLLCSMTAGKAITLKAAIVEFKASFV